VQMLLLSSAIAVVLLRDTTHVSWGKETKQVVEMS
jgi:hypothetical protein